MSENDTKSTPFQNLSENLFQFFRTLVVHREAVDFIRKHRIWVGMFRYGWVSRVLIIISILLGWQFLMTFFKWYNSASSDGPAAMMSSMGTLFQDMAVEGYNFLFLGGMKYIMLILLEVIIFHFCRRTLELKSGISGNLAFNDFLQAQIRMIKVVIRSWVLESILGIMVSIAIGMIGFLEFLKPVLIFGIQCYFLGFVIIDNYNEQFGMTIKESFKYSRAYVGVALASGLILTLLLYIPVVGPILGPILVSVAVTLAMYELSDLQKRRGTSEEEPEQNTVQPEH